MQPRTHLITDVPTLDRMSLDHVVSVAGTAADAIQVRAKDATDRALVAWTSALVDRVRSSGVRVIVNDRLDVALAAGADGVHVGADDLPVGCVRALVDDGFLVGATTRGAEDVRRAIADGADYCGVGPVFATSTKAGLPAPVGLDVLREAATLGPVIAIGGVTPARVGAVMAAGAHGFAVVSAVWQAVDPPRVMEELAGLARAQ